MPTAGPTARPTVSLVVPSGLSWAAARRLLSSLDQLRTPAARFEVVFLRRDAEQDPLPAQLDVLSDHRPNLRVLDEAGGDWLSQVRGSYLLGLTGDLTVLPGAVNDLVGRAEADSVDAVAGRVVGRFGEITGAVGDPADENATVWLVRTDRVDLGQRPWPGPATDASRSLLDDRAVVVRHDPAAVQPPLAASAAASWQDGAVLLAAGLDRPAESARFAVQHGRTYATYWIPAAVSSGVDGHGAQLTAQLDPRSAAAGEPLPAGPWIVRVEVDEDDRTSVLNLPGTSTAPALVGGTGYLVAGLPTLTLDVGPSTGRLLPALDPAAAVVTETHRGSWLEFEVTGLHTHDTTGLDGTLFLDGLGFRSRLGVADGRVAVQGFVSGVAGKAVLETAFGSGRKQPTGLSLHVDGIGEMKVITTPPPAPKKSASPTEPAVKKTATKTAKKTAKRPAAPPPRRGPVAKLRRALPHQLDPLARRLSRIPALKKLYRGVTGVR